MKQTREKIVGIIGGMGPEATVDLPLDTIDASQVLAEEIVRVVKHS